MRPDLPISLVAEYTFCPRSAWLAYVAGQFTPNEFTVEGKLLHRRAHQPSGPSEKTKRWRKVAVWSERYGIYGYADVVEKVGTSFIPVEYKRGKAFLSWSDRVHLALIALCLEEMLKTSIPKGYLFYFGSRRRVEVELGPDLRRGAIRAVQMVREMVAQGTPPPAQLRAKCRGCAQAPGCLADLKTAFSWAEWLR